MTARDELAAELWKHHYEEFTMNPDGMERSYCRCGARVYPMKSLVQHQAEVAIAHRKPRTITTAEELEALEVTAVIRGKWLAEKWADEEGEMWHVAGKGMNWDTEQLVQRGGLPATVLYEGTQP